MSCCALNSHQTIKFFLQRNNLLHLSDDLELILDILTKIFVKIWNNVGDIHYNQVYELTLCQNSIRHSNYSNIDIVSFISHDISGIWDILSKKFVKIWNNVGDIHSNPKHELSWIKLLIGRSNFSYKEIIYFISLIIWRWF
jgi:hypothetical protein